MFRTLSLVICCGSLLVLSGCDLFGGDSDFEIKTDKNTYTAGDELVVSAKNNTSDVIHYSTCMPTSLQELADDKVVESIGFPICQCICSAELAPGETYEWTVGTQWLWQNQGPSQPKIGPKYQFRFAFYKDKAMKKSLNPTELTSNTFTFTSDVAPTN